MIQRKEGILLTFFRTCINQVNPNSITTRIVYNDKGTLKCGGQLP